MRRHKVAVWVGLLVLVLTGAASALDFSEIARFNIDSASSDNTAPEYIGNNPSAVAWSGSQLFVGGFNNSGVIGNVGIVEVLSATSTGMIGTPTYGPVATYTTVPNARGITGMDVAADGASLAVTHDDGLAGTPDGYAVYNTSDYVRRWSDDVRGSSGTAFDPGFGGDDAGTAFGAFSSGRRILYDTTTGANVYDTSNGMIWWDGNGGTLTRDMDFDPLSGDIYVRHNNNLSKATRTAGNVSLPDGIINSVSQADNVNIQNLSFLSQVSDGGQLGDFLIFNDRTGAAALQDFNDVIQVIDTSGTSVTANFAFLDGDLPGTGVGAYDFDFDPVTDTLALVDFANRNVHIFAVGSTDQISGDFDNNGVYECLDVDSLVVEIVAGTNQASFDLTGDGFVNILDLDAWRAEAGAAQLTSGNPYPNGDANLDGTVDVGDFNVWNGNKFTVASAWCLGDFNADGVVDVPDFGIWNGNKFTSADGVASVPEPAAGIGMLIAAGWCGILLRRRTSVRPTKSSTR